MTESISHGIIDYTLGHLDMLSFLHVIEMEHTYSHNQPFKSEKKETFFFFKYMNTVFGVMPQNNFSSRVCRTPFENSIHPSSNN